MVCVVGVLVAYNPDEKIFTDVVDLLCNQLAHLIIIDNASLNINFVESCSASLKNCTLISLSNNIGLASAQNLGISCAKTKNATHVVFFDQDSSIDNAFISALLLTEFELSSLGYKIAAIGPTFYNPSTNINYPATVFCGPFIRKLNVEDKPIQATFLISSGCMIRIQALDDVGLMRDELFIDYIDVDWSFRASSKGYKLYISPLAKMGHIVGDTRVSVFGRSISMHSPLRRYYLIRNFFYILREKNIPFFYKVRELVLNVLRVLVTVFFSSQKKQYIHYAVLGVADGLNGIYGKCMHLSASDK